MRMLCTKLSLRMHALHIRSGTIALLHVALLCSYVIVLMHGDHGCLTGMHAQQCTCTMIMATSRSYVGVVVACTWPGATHAGMLACMLTMGVKVCDWSWDVRSI